MTPDTIDNGRRVPVDFGAALYQGLAGVRDRAGTGEVACQAALPFGQVQVTGTVDGRAVRVLSVRKSDTTAGMVIISFAFLEDAA